MRTSAVKYAVLSWVSLLTMVIFFLVPFHALLTVWGSSLIGHYTALRLWKEVLLVICIIGVVYLYLFDTKIRYHTFSRRLVWTILCYMALNIAWGLLALNQHDVTAKALGYGLIVNLRFLAFFLVTWSVALRMGRLRIHWQWLVIYPAIGVVVFGLLQIFVLPHDFLRHFGYGPNTIPPFETINHNSHYVRFASTLRGANPLGAYLLVPISLLAVLLVRNGRNWGQALLMAGSVVLLFFSFSRSAWIGAALSVVVVLFLSHLAPKTQRLALFVTGGMLVIAAIVALAFRHDIKYQNLIFHTQKNSAVAATSDQGHLKALRAGLHDVWHHPGGDGPGTAGPASYYNTGHPVRIAENYYVQIGQETGWIGLALFVLINAGVGYLLFLRRDDPLALSLFASLIGLTFINLFSHAWADDTLAYVWWGLAGVALAPNPKAKAEHEKAR
ncbi:MAG TPA: O-antigen ligase family protein [Candidatus Saccharimonadia bacterium]|nr:O-antigen ligase family protein [Candidatus Saccharimonadia bacterium]